MYIIIIVYYLKKNINSNVFHIIFTNWQKLFSKRIIDDKRETLKTMYDKLTPLFYETVGFLFLRTDFTFLFL